MTVRLPQFLVFIGGGLLSAAVDIGLMQLLLINNVGAVGATSAGFALGLAVNYAYHAKVTFKNLSTWHTIVRFLCVVGINYALTLGLVMLGASLFDLPLLGKIVSLPVVAVNGFFLSKFWVFK